MGFRKDSYINFTVEAKWHAMQTPSASYNLGKFETTRPRTLDKKIHGPKGVASWKIAKEDGPAPGSYDTVKADFST